MLSICFLTLFVFFSLLPISTSMISTILRNYPSRKLFQYAVSTQVNSEDMLSIPTNICHYSNNIKNSTIYPTLDQFNLFDSVCIIVKSPSPSEYEFYTNFSYSHDTHDVNTEEVLFGKNKEGNNKSRWNKFLGGRVALRRALRSINRGHAASILTDHFGAPTLPSQVVGSISHKDDLAAGIARVDDSGHLGIDLEHMYNKAAATLWRRILTPDEQSRVGSLSLSPSLSPSYITMEEETLLRFSFKEAVYKAIHPYLKRSIDFREVEVEPTNNGSANINFKLKTGEEFDYKAYWQRYREKYWLTCVYVSEIKT
mmetsp:Transcript_15134/g.15261  ORF Transcript_15134/g.15261 Transcript_15134/m.15261 type:complete len:312 (+) Transcript_15134:352-1287(+)